MMKSYSLSRQGLPPIRFEGEIVGEGTTHSHQGSGQNRWTEVDIYRTKGGKFVVQVARMTIWEGESDHYSAASKATPKEIIDWLKGDDGTLGKASQEAVENAVKNCQEFAAVWVENVE